jgi:predicted membrane-bound spermidine synthase
MQSMLWVYFIFVLSGFAALLYQVVWQRALFAIYGINVESVTVIVTAFMLGLGLGSLAGGAVSRDPKRPVLLLFSLVELGIGLYGFASLALFRWMGSFTLGIPTGATFFMAFGLVLLPTMLMGGTLPLLVAHSVRRSGSVGRSVSVLYFVNTLGSALASAAAVFLLLGNLGQSRTVALAGCINLTVSAVAWGQHVRSRKNLAGTRPLTTPASSVP